MELPIRSIIAFNGTLAQAQTEEKNGYWICDGQRVIKDKKSPLNGQTTPDLRRRFLPGSDNNVPGQTGGQATYRIPSQTIDSHTTGGFGPPSIHGDPFTHMQGAHSWTTDAAIYSQGTWQAADVPTLPPFFSVIYLIKVR